MVNQPVYFTNPNAFLPPEQRQQTLAEQLAGAGFLSPGVEAPGGQMFYNVAPEMRDLIGGIPYHMYAVESITPEFMRYMAQSWAGGQRSSRSPDQLRKMFPSYLHQFMPQLDPRTQVRYKTTDDPDKFGPDHYSYAFDPIAAPQFQELPSADIQQQISRQTEADAEREQAEYDRDRRPLLRSGAGRSMFGTGRT